MCETAVLLIFFNRPDVLKETFAAIKEARPRKLYLAQDGPRPGNLEDKNLIEACRKIVEMIDWDCEVHTRYSEINQGCGMGPFSAINWVFQFEDEAIILEDDCIASASFFTFCDLMLERYRNDERIFMITGCNFELETQNNKNSYFFGLSGTNWGWATWKRNWDKMDYNCSWIESKDIVKHLKEMFKRESSSKYKRELRYFEETYRRLKSGENISYWDVQWQAIRYLNHQLSIIPAKNLITNIGLGPTSTHAKHRRIPERYYSTVGEIHFGYNTRYELTFPLTHPAYVQRNYEYDDKIDKNISPSIFKKVLIKLRILES